MRWLKTISMGFTDSTQQETSSTFVLWSHSPYQHSQYRSSKWIPRTSVDTRSGCRVNVSPCLVRFHYSVSTIERLESSRTGTRSSRRVSVCETLLLRLEISRQRSGGPGGRPCVLPLSSHHPCCTQHPVEVRQELWMWDESRPRGCDRTPAPCRLCPRGTGVWPHLRSRFSRGPHTWTILWAPREPSNKTPSLSQVAGEVSFVCNQGPWFIRRVKY